MGGLVSGKVLVTVGALETDVAWGGTYGLCDLWLYYDVSPHLGTRGGGTGHGGAPTVLGRGAPGPGWGRDTGAYFAGLFPEGTGCHRAFVVRGFIRYS